MFKQKETLFILWLTFLTVVAWIGFNIYHIMATSTINDIDAASIIPITPKFDMDTINKLKTREIVEPVYQFIGTTQDNTATSSSETPIAPDENIIPQVSVEP